VDFLTEVPSLLDMSFDLNTGARIGSAASALETRWRDKLSIRDVTLR
jgi:hypothetical protein